MTVRAGLVVNIDGIQRLRTPFVRTAEGKGRFLNVTCLFSRFFVTLDEIAGFLYIRAVREIEDFEGSCSGKLWLQFFYGGHLLNNKYKKWGEKANYSHNFSTFAPKIAYKRRRAIIL